MMEKFVNFVKNIMNNIKKIGVFVLSISLLFISGCDQIEITGIDDIKTNYINNTSSTSTTNEEVDKGYEILLCLEKNGVKMYGMFTCGHCNTQKKSLGPKAELEFDRVYVECSPYVDDNQSLDCIANDINRVPTWIFSEDVVVEGFIDMERLQELSGCTDDLLF